MTAAEGGRVLDEVESFIRRYVVLPSEAAFVAITLWAAHAHAVDAAESTPRLAFLSPEPASGKTRALEVLELLVPNPMLAVNATPAAIFRAVGDLDPRPTILFDEIDTIFGPRAKDNEELRGLLNAGHRRSGKAYRCAGEGSKQKSMPFPAYAAVALAGLGKLPDTITTRAILIRMRRRAPGEQVESFRMRDTVPVGRELSSRLGGFAGEVYEDLALARPDMPSGIRDRPADVWDPLLAIADAAGGRWPERARAACVEFVTAAANDVHEASPGVRLLADTRTAFGDADRMPTEDLLAALHGLPESPWDNFRGKQLNATTLAELLRPYGVAARKIKFGARALQGYRVAELRDAWQRYLPRPSPPGAEPLEPPEPSRSAPVKQVPLVGLVPEPAGEPEPATPDLTCAVPPVPAVPAPPVAGAAAPADGIQLADGGPCARCSRTTRRYGGRGSPLCDMCRPDAARPAAQAKPAFARAGGLAAAGVGSTGVLGH